MAYRICTFDSTGKITSISKESYPTTNYVVKDIVLQNPKAFAFIDETIISTALTDRITGSDDEVISNIDGVNFIISGGDQRSTQYDPRTEVVLVVNNQNLQFNHDDRVHQDVTKVTTFNNPIDVSTRPIHSTAQVKFGSASGKFTKSFLGYTGGGLLVTNISKNNYAGYTAPHNTLGANATVSYAMEFFFYPTSASSNFTIMQKGAAGASANWKIGYDSSAGFLQFAWQSYGTTSGYNYSRNIINTAGMTLNMWHHAAVAVIRNVSAGTGYLISGYFNGRNVFTEGVTLTGLPEFRYGDGIRIGCDSAGNEAFSGYIDSLRVLESSSTGGIFTTYGFLPYGSGTLSVPQFSGFTRSSQTAFILNFNGVPDSSDFYGESKDFISGTVTRVSNLTFGLTGSILSDRAEVGVRNIVRYTMGYTGVTGYSDPTGYTLSYGHIVLPFVPSSGNTLTHGTDFVHPLIDVIDNNLSLDVFRINYRTDTIYDTNQSLLAMIEGAYQDKGSKGSVFQTQYGTNPFIRLFGTGGCGNCYGVGLAHNSLYIDPLDTETMRYIMENGYLASQGIVSASYSFVDGRGIMRNLTSTDMINLRLDILDYQNTLINNLKETISTIDGAATKNDVKYAKNNKPSGSEFAVISPPEEFDTGII